MKIVIMSCAILLVSACIHSAFAQNKVVVIPMFDEAKPLANIITVSTKNGDFSDPIAAMASINDASAGNPYLIIIGPGVYTLGAPLIIKSFVSVTGSGQKVTILEAGYGASTREDAAVIKSTSFSNTSSVSSLTINQYGFGSQISGGIHISSSRIEVSDIDINVTSSGSDNYGMYVSSGTPSINDVEIYVDNGQSTNYGIYLDNGSQAKLNHIDILARGGTFSVGVYANSANSRFDSIRSTARDASGTSWGIYNNTGAVVTASRGNFSGETYGCFVSSDSDVIFEHSTIANGCSVVSGGRARCLYSSNGSVGNIASGCDPIF